MPRDPVAVVAEFWPSGRAGVGHLAARGLATWPRGVWPIGHATPCGRTVGGSRTGQLAAPRRPNGRTTAGLATCGAENAAVEPSVLRKGLVKTFRAAAIAEAVTWAGLLIGMFFKYIVVKNQFGVQVFGPTHGFVMGFYIITVFLVKPELPWGRRELAIGLAASV